MTNISEIFKNSLAYPSTDVMALLVLGVLFIISGLGTIFGGFGYRATGIVSSILGILSFIVSIIIFGYELSVIKEGAEKGNTIPGIEPVKNFIDGIKYIILAIVYFIIPAIITIVLLFATGTINAVINIITFYTNYGINATIPTQYLESLFVGGTAVGIISAILFILFALLYLIGSARLAKYDSLSEGLSMGKVIGDINTIGWGSYILWYIIYIILGMILTIIAGLIVFIPFIGALIAYLIIIPFITLFASRAIGELYSNA